MWHRRMVEKIKECVGEFWPFLFSNVENQFAWAFAGACGANADGVRRYLCDWLVY
jgi:hypothetical protein